MSVYTVRECTPKVITRKDGTQITKYMCMAEGVDRPIEFWRYLATGSEISGTLQDTGFNSYRLLEEGMPDMRRKPQGNVRNNRSIEKQSARKDAVALVNTLINSGAIKVETPADVKAHIQNLYDFMEDLIREDPDKEAPF